MVKTTNFQLAIIHSLAVITVTILISQELILQKIFKLFTEAYRKIIAKSKSQSKIKTLFHL